MAIYSLVKKFIVSFFAVFAFFVHGASDAPERVSVFVTKGDSVTLHTNITLKQQWIKWYFIDTLIAQLNLSNISTDYSKDEEIFRDGVKLDHQTGDLTITNISASDAGVYHLKIFSKKSHAKGSFDVAVLDVPVAEKKKKSVKKGEPVTLDTPEVKNPDNVMMWYFNDTLIAVVTGDQSQICTDDKCDERFRDRLELDQTGSLTITDTRTTDSGDYELQIKSNRERYSTTSIKSFSVSVTDLLPAAVGIGVGVVFGVVVLLMAAGVIYYKCKKNRKHVPINDEESHKDQRGSQHRAVAKKRRLRAVPSPTRFSDLSFQSLTESESEVE